MATTPKRLYTVHDKVTGDKIPVRSSTPGRARNRYRALRLEASLATQEEMYDFGVRGVPILDEDDEIAAEAMEALNRSEGMPGEADTATWEEPEHRPLVEPDPVATYASDPAFNLPQ